MYSREISRQFEQDTEAAEAALTYGAEHSPEFVSSEREAELRGDLEKLYPPAIDRSGVVQVQEAHRVDDPIVYIPTIAGKIIEKVVILGDAEPVVMESKDFYDRPGAEMYMAKIRERHPEQKELVCEFPFAIFDYPSNETTDPLDGGAYLLHELTHKRQYFRGPSWLAVPPAPNESPIYRELSDDYGLKLEAEAWRMTVALENLESRAKLDSCSEQVEDWLLGFSKDNETGFSTLEIVNYLFKYDLWRADEQPNNIVKGILLELNII